MNKRKKSFITEFNKKQLSIFRSQIINFAKPEIANYARSSQFIIDSLKGTQNQEAYKIFFKAINLFSYNFVRKYVKQGTCTNKREAELIVENQIKRWARTHFRSKDKIRFPFEAII
jgi:hypothetical protein